MPSGASRRPKAPRPPTPGTAERLEQAAARLRVSNAYTFLETYTRDLNSQDLRRIFTLEAPEAYRFFVKNVNEDQLAAMPWHKRWATRTRLLFVAFTSRLSPARRAIYGLAVLAAVLGALSAIHGIKLMWLPTVPVVGPHVGIPVVRFGDGTFWLITAFLLMNLLVLLEVADRLTLKRDLEIAREIQLAMLPQEMVVGGGIEAYGFTRPANTVGGDFYDVLPMTDGRLVIALGDVAGKGSPAALLMALTLAILRTLVDENLPPTTMMERLNVQVSRHAPSSRFVTLCLSIFDSVTGGPDVPERRTDTSRPEARAWCNRTSDRGRCRAGHVRTGKLHGGRDGPRAWRRPGVLQRRDYRSREPGRGAVRRAGLIEVIERHWWEDAATIGTAIVSAVQAHAVDTRLADDLTVLAIRRPLPLPGTAGAALLNTSRVVNCSGRTWRLPLPGE